MSFASASCTPLRTPGSPLEAHSAAFESPQLLLGNEASANRTPLRTPASPLAAQRSPFGSPVHLASTSKLDSLLSPSRVPSAPKFPNHTDMMADTALNWSPFPEALLDLTNSTSPFAPTDAPQDVTLEHLQELLEVLRDPEDPSPLTGSFLNPSASSSSQLLPLPQDTPTCTGAAMSLQSNLLDEWLLDPRSSSTFTFSPVPACLSQVCIRSCVSVCICSVLWCRVIFSMHKSVLCVILLLTIAVMLPLHNTGWNAICCSTFVGLYHVRKHHLQCIDLQNTFLLGSWLPGCLPVCDSLSKSWQPSFSCVFMSPLGLVHNVAVLARAHTASGGTTSTWILF